MEERCQVKIFGSGAVIGNILAKQAVFRELEFGMNSEYRGLFLRNGSLGYDRGYQIRFICCVDKKRFLYSISAYTI